MNSAVEEARKKYSELFPDNESKAKAFDAIAERYYFANFSSMLKSDLDVLMFSLYIERILDVSESDAKSYSDYTLSKYLGITQTRISNLKIKKELQYPYEKFSWKTSFERVLKNYRYDNGKIMLFIPDRNLYLELKNAIEESEGYVEITLNPTLLQVTPEYFIDLLMVVLPENECKHMRDKVNSECYNRNIKISECEKKSIGSILKNYAPNIIIDVVCSVLEKSVPFISSSLGDTLKQLIESIKERSRKK